MKFKSICSIFKLLINQIFITFFIFFSYIYQSHADIIISYRYQSPSKEEKENKQQYGHERYKHLPEN